MVRHLAEPFVDLWDGMWPGLHLEIVTRLGESDMYLSKEEGANVTIVELRGGYVL